MRQLFFDFLVFFKRFERTQYLCRHPRAAFVGTVEFSYTVVTADITFRSNRQMHSGIFMSACVETRMGFCFFLNTEFCLFHLCFLLKIGFVYLLPIATFLPLQHRIGKAVQKGKHAVVTKGFDSLATHTVMNGKCAADQLDPVFFFYSSCIRAADHQVGIQLHCIFFNFIKMGLVGNDIIFYEQSVCQILDFIFNHRLKSGGFCPCGYHHRHNSVFAAKPYDGIYKIRFAENNGSAFCVVFV